MKMELLKSEDMGSEQEEKIGIEDIGIEDIGIEDIGIEDHTTNIDEFIPGEDIKESLLGAFELAIGALEAEGYESFTDVHPRYGRKVIYLVKGENVMVADYSGTNLLTIEVLDRDEAAMIIGMRRR